MAEWGEGDPLTNLQQAAPDYLQDKIRAESQAIEGQRKPVTILFSDIVGSTRLAESLDPEEWKEILNGAHRRVSAAVYRYEGTIAQLLGDGVLAFFGAPVVHEDDPTRAVRAALDIQAAMGEYARELAGLLDSFQVRIGINTGTVVVGAVGDDMHMEYLAIGDSVNLAARLQAATEPGSILISEATARLVETTFELSDQGQIEVKGKTKPVRIFDVLGLKEAPDPGRGIKGLNSSLVGREVEFGSLQQAVEALEEGRGGMVFILGEAGIGKSRLVEEVRSRCTSEIHWLEGRSLSYGQGLSYWAITRMIRADLGVGDGDPEVKIRVALRGRLNKLLGSRAEAAFPFLGHLFGLSLDEGEASIMKDLDGETVRFQTIKLLADYFEALAMERPAVLIFEDLHWADASTLEALESLLAVTDKASLMLLLLTRADRDHGSWAIKFQAETDYGHRYHEIPLTPLSEEDAGALVQNLLSITDLPADTRQLMLDRADGNPFYLEELIRSLIDRRALVPEGGSWRISRKIGALEIPETLQGVLLARLDRLDEEIRATLQLAAVIGRSFPYRLLETASEEETDLELHLAQLQRADLVREKSRLPEVEYIFKHSLIQEAAYQSLLRDRRRKYHRLVGAALENRYADRLDEVLGLLAHHFDKAGDVDKALEYLTQAGDKTSLEDAHQEAVVYYRRALELLEGKDDDQGAARIWMKLGLVFHSDFQFDKAHQAFEKSADIAQKAFTDGEPASARVGLSSPGMEITMGVGPGYPTNRLDPGTIRFVNEQILVDGLFAGLARMEADWSLVPHAARSWEVLEAGRRYLIHLRQDVTWSDGLPVTAHDYEWAWKRNLAPGFSESTAELLGDVKNAKAYQRGEIEDPDSVGVRALDEFTLEVILESPVAYFPYILATSVSYPLPRSAIQKHGVDWSLPPNMANNGPFILAKYDFEKSVKLALNPDYFNVSSCKLAHFEIRWYPDLDSRIDQFRGGLIDAIVLKSSEVPPDLASLVVSAIPGLSLDFLALAPKPPLDDRRVRRALFLAMDREELAKFHVGEPAHGGILPPGMPGHTPGLSLPDDPILAQELLAEAGYPGGLGFPRLTGITFGHRPGSQISARWREVLGIDIEIEQMESVAEYQNLDSHLLLLSWSADFPDPDIFLRSATFLSFLRTNGWQDADYDNLVAEAVSDPVRSQRLAKYRQADQCLVLDQAIINPIAYNNHFYVVLVQPEIREKLEHEQNSGPDFAMLRRLFHFP